MYTNHLVSQKSPYLLQHAHNPVNWFPWDKEAFEKANKEQKPIFLSIGYSTCHWCHVMEQESFEDEEIADILNQNFISIKVDKEERPDIDSVYMSVCQMLTGSGGWPLTIIMTPSQKPFFAGTYFPKHQIYNHIGLFELLTNVSKLWQTNQNKLLSAGEEITQHIKNQNKKLNNIINWDNKYFKTAFDELSKSFDTTYGGFGNAPKFPIPHNLLFLLKYYTVEKNKDALSMVELTLINMYKGGIYDHIGGGFSRYSTDSKWLVPHFEKMLYDNALLAIAYIETYRLTKKEIYKYIAQNTLNYILKELTNENGGFLCSQDADSEGIEGKYYVFTPEEINNILGQKDGELFCKWFDISKKGNFENQNIPNLINNKQFEIEPDILNNLKDKIYQYRIKRTKLHKDDKVLTSWNSLAIVAFSYGFKVFGNKQYLIAAQNATDFIQKNLKYNDKYLKIRWREGETAYNGNLDDYAYYVWAMLTLYAACFDIKYLKEAEIMADSINKLFSDMDKNGFYFYASNSEQLINRPKEIYDGALPSGNSVIAFGMQRLFQLTGKIKWKEFAQNQINFLASNIKDYPSAYCFSLISMMEAFYPSSELICVLPKNINLQKIHEFANQKEYPPIIIVKTPENEKLLSEIAPFTSEYEFLDNTENYYYCQGNVCKPPVTNLNELL